MKVVVQIGYSKTAQRRRVGQLVKAYLNDSELTFSAEGKYLTSRAEVSKGLLWYMCNLDVLPSDVLKLEVKTFILGAGCDEAKTFESLYYVDAEAPVREVVSQGVGYRGYPLIKGRILEVGSVSEADKRKSDIDNFLREGF